MTHVAMFVTSNLIHDSRVRREAESLSSAGHRVTVFSHISASELHRLRWDSPSHPRAIPVERPAWTRKRGLRRLLDHSNDLLRWGGSRALLQAAHDCRADVYHAHDLDTLPAAAQLAKRFGARLVYDSHELFLDMIAPDPEAAAPRWSSRVKQGLTRRSYARLERALIGDADAVITVSSSIAAELAERYEIPLPTLVLNCPPYQDMGAGSTDLRQRLDLSPEQRIILLQGGILPGRGLLELVRSLLLLPEEYVLVFLGFNLGTYQEPIRQEIARLGLVPRVHLLDALPSERLLDATASADVGVLLLAGRNRNDRFALPNKLFEYMMAGLPFVATDWPEVGRVIRQTGAGMPISPLTPDAIAAGIRHVLGDSARWQAMRLAGLDAARREFNWSRQSEHLLEIYRGI